MLTPKRRVIVLWEPLAMLALGTVILMAVQAMGPLARLIAGIAVGMLFVSAGVTFVLWLKNFNGD